jgi:DNA repair protein RadA/Sms
LLLVTAVLSRRAGIKLGNQDILVNVIGGLRVEEPSADLGISLAIASSYRDVEVEPGLVVMGEVGLSGELRSVAQIDRRIAEAARLGFKRCLIPDVGGSTYIKNRDIELVAAATIKEALNLGLIRRRPSGRSGESA